MSSGNTIVIKYLAFLIGHQWPIRKLILLIIWSLQKNMES